MGVTPRFTPRERGALVAAVVTGGLVPLNSTMIAVGLPDIAEHTGVEPGRAAVLVTAYLVVMLVCQPIGGRTGDRVGHRRVTVCALGGFGIASVLAAVAPSFVVLLGARCLQAVFGAALSPNLAALLRHTIDVSRRGRAFGLMGSGIGTGAAIGPVLGGALVALWDWRLMFVANAPVVLVAIVLVSRLREVDEHSNDAIPGARDPAAANRPSMLSLLRRPPFLAACVTQAFSNFSLYATLLMLPIVLAAKGWSSGPTGVAVSVLTVGMLLLSPVGGRLGDVHGRAPVVTAGMAVTVVGCMAMAAFIDASPLLIASTLVLGCGQGMAGASLQTAAVEAAPLDSAASAAGIYSTSRYVGSIASSVLIAALAVSDATSARPLAIIIVVSSLVATIAGSRVEGGRVGAGLQVR